MSFSLQPDSDFQKLQPNPEQFEQNYHYNMSFLARKTIFAHFIKCLAQVRSKLKQLDLQQANINNQINDLRNQDLPNLTFDEQTMNVSKKGAVTLREVLQENDTSAITNRIAITFIWRQFKWQIIHIVLLFNLQIACKLSVSIFLQQLFSLVANINEGNNRNLAIINVFICGILWIIGQIGRNNGYTEVAILIGKLRSQLVFFIYLRVSKVSQYTVKSQELGKIINLLSNDFNAFEIKFPIFFASTASPLALIGIFSILIFRFGWFSTIFAGVIFMLFSLQFFVGKLNGNIMKKINIYKDKRVKVCVQSIQGIKPIKLYGWEIFFKHAIQSLRLEQIKNYFKFALGTSFIKVLGSVPSRLSSFTCFAIMDVKAKSNSLSNASIFSTIQLLSSLEELLYFISISIGFYFQLQITFERICSILNTKDKRKYLFHQGIKVNTQQNSYQNFNNFQNIGFQTNKSKIPSLQLKKGELIFQNFVGFWESNGKIIFTLKNINLKIEQGKFIGITGKIGSGKSSFLAALLEQIPCFSGLFTKCGTLAYVQQQPIIFSGNVRQNITFGSNYDQKKYERAVQMSCLSTDLQILRDGDLTIVGQRGITLSGGQKARICLARALYFDFDIYIFDDPISAVDSRVAKKIFENVMQKLKGEKTIILVTHQVSYLYDCDEIIIMDNGKITERGSPEKLKSKLENFDSKSNNIEGKGQINQKQIKMVDENKQPQNEKSVQIEKQRNIPFYSQINSEYQAGKDIKQNENDVKITWHTYVKYLFYTKLNYFLLPLSLVFFCAAQAANTFYYRIFAQYDDTKNNNGTSTFTQMSDFWVALGFLIFGYFVFSVIKYFTLNFVILNSNKAIHEDMIQGLMRSSTAYFDVASTGKLNSIFSNDLGIIDIQIIIALTDIIQCAIISIILLVNVIQINKFFIFLSLINITVVIYGFIYCKRSIVELQHLNLKTKSPIFQMVGQMMRGLIQIKIFNRRFSLLKQFAQKLNESFKCYICYVNISRAFAAYVNYISIFITIIGWMIGIMIVEPETSGLFAVSIVFLTQIIDSFQWFLRQIINLQSLMVSVGRGFKIKDLQKEKQFRSLYDRENHIPCRQFVYNNETDSYRVRINDYQNQVVTQRWPEKGTLKITNFSMRYRPQLPLVLKYISFDIKDKQKVGIVGRTGAGKSSLVQALFRIAEPQQGSQFQIGGVNAFQLGLHTLRQNISIIPQTPFLFRGTVKQNLDPFDQKSDEQIWQALSQSGLREAIQKLPSKLMSDISNVSEVFSIGEKQLLCLARALLQKNKFLILDEATSNLDMTTDGFIQNCIKTKFRDTTVITIAHRLNTIAHYDKIVVMEQGRVKQIGSPYQLLLKNGVFSEMVEYTGTDAQNIRKTAKQNYQQKHSQKIKIGDH